MSMGIVASIGGAVIGGLATMSAADTAADAQNAATSASSAIANRQQAMAEEQWNRYKSTYAPIEDQMAGEAYGVGSIANQNKAAGDAAAVVAARAASAYERLNKMPGVNPSSQQYQQEASKLALGEAATSAAAQTGARETVKSAGKAAMTNAVSLGKGLPASATGMMSSASGLYGNLATGARQDGINAANNAASIGRMASGVFNSKGVQDWMNGSSSNPTYGGAIPTGTTANAAAFGGGGQMDDLASYGVF